MGGLMSIIIKRDKSPKGRGKSPQFKMRIEPMLKIQFENAAKNAGMSLSNWFKSLGRERLLQMGIQPHDSKVNDGKD